jgi:choline dehydrogenase-like flavoprotein
MFIDLNQVDSDPFRDKTYDVCICGAGVAGITLALKLSPRISVALLEAGGFEYSEDSQAVYQGKSIGKAYFDLASARLRYFGGSSNHWTGNCRPLDSYDFDHKSYLEYSGWPIERGDLDPYLEEAKSIFDIPATTGEIVDSAHSGLWDELASSNNFRQIGFWSSPTRFGKKYRQAINSAPNITCYLNANVVDITLYESLSRFKNVTVRNYREKSFKITAQTLVVAAGGLENPRLLLNSNGQMEDGLGNGNGLVGRFFTEHLHHKAGGFILEDPARETFVNNWHRKYFSPTEKFMNQNKALNFGITILPKSSISDADENQIATRGFKKKLRQVICESAHLKEMIEKLRGTEIWCPELPNDGSLRIASEQAPNPSSQITLGSDLDSFGNRRIVLDWKLSEIDKHTIQCAIMEFAKNFAASSVGRIQIPGWLAQEEIIFPKTENNIHGWTWGIGGYHHMCTTRMGSTPRDGVVDSNQMVFGIENLYVAGSSVFSTAGHANPTFTIVQMTLRLADHLNDKNTHSV